jgi:hypothetical protein
MDVTLPIEVIRGKIYLIRGQKVLLDRDLAEMYGAETRSLNQAVRRHINRFPEDFMLTLTRDEIRNLSQIVISPGLKHAPNVFAFTEQGVAMLSSVLNSDRAVQVNIAIMRAFVQMRELAASNRALARKLDELEKKHDWHDKQFIEVFDAIRGLMAPTEKKGRKIGFGQEEKE